MKLVKYPNDFLFKKVNSFDWEKLNPIQISNKMTEIMKKNKGIGISANQVAINAEIFIIDSLEHGILTCINPKIIKESDKKIVGKEGCLSFPDVFMEVSRSDSITVEFLDIFAQSCILDLTGRDARCFLHEYDHLKGKVFLF